MIYYTFYTFLYKDSFTIRNLLINVLSNNISNTYGGILWFLQNLVQLYILFPLLKVVHDHNKKIYNYFFVIIIIFTIGKNSINLLLQIMTIKLGMNNAINYFNSFVESYNPLLNEYFILYFMLGGMIAENKDWIRKNKNKIYFLSAISIFLVSFYGIVYSKELGYFYSSNFNYDTVFMVVITIGIYTLCNDIIKVIINPTIKKGITFIGKNTMGIYLFHLMVIRIANLIVNIQITNLFVLFFYDISILLICSMIVYLISFNKYLKKLINI